MDQQNNTGISVAHPDLLAEIHAFCERVGMAHSRFGFEALNDPNFVADLASGRECRRKTQESVRQFMSERGAP